MLLGVGAVVLAVAVGEPILYVLLAPLALIFTPVGVVEIVRAARQRRH